MWASLANSPPPSTSNDGATVFEAETNMVCELQLQADRMGHFKLEQILASRPTPDPHTLLDPAGSKLIRSRSTSSAKSAFLGPVNRAEKAVVAWHEEGWLAALDELSSYSNRSDSTIPQKFAGWLASSLLYFWKCTFSLYGSITPTSKVSEEMLVNNYSSVRDWSSSLVRAISWHPHSAKLAIALRDETIHISGIDLQVSPVLKHKQQRGITCLAWRPYMASELAVGCVSGVFIWHVDPLSVVARPSANCVHMLPTPTSHAPIADLAYHPEGKYLLSSSARDASVLIWCTASQRHTPIKCVHRFGDGIQRALWSPRGNAIFVATLSSVFKIINTNDWSLERWKALAGHVKSACWSSCGSALVFTTNQETQIYCLRFTVDENNFVSAGSAVPIMDLAKVSYTLDDGEEISAGGIVQCMRWDPTDSRLVLSFVDSPVLAILSTRIDLVGISVSPIGYIRGRDDEVPTSFEFAPDFSNDNGALLTIAWSSGRLQHFPMFFTSLNAVVQSGVNNSIVINTSTDFRPQLFSSPAIE